MATITLTGTQGAKQKQALSTDALAITIAKPSGSPGGRCQVIGNEEWLYGSADHGATADDWLTVAAGVPMTMASGMTFYAKVASGTPNLHFVEV
jgi:hypothetical protein